MSNPHRISLDRIAQAATLIDPVFLNSPQFLAESLGAQLGCRLVVKVETANPIRSFKGRGAEYLAAMLAGQPRLVCASAGNFGQGMAFAARKRGLSLTVFAAVSANPLKIERMRALGAEVRLEGEDFDAAKLAARAFAAEAGARFVEDSRDVETAEGAGTIGIELLRWPEPFDTLLVPLGNGALLAGIARWVKAHHPATQMIGVSASGAPAMERSWRSGQIERLSGSHDRGWHWRCGCPCPRRSTTWPACWMIFCWWKTKRCWRRCGWLTRSLGWCSNHPARWDWRRC